MAVFYLLTPSVDVSMPYRFVRRNQIGKRATVRLHLEVQHLIDREVCNTITASTVMSGLFSALYVNRLLKGHMLSVFM